MYNNRVLINVSSNKKWEIKLNVLKSFIDKTLGLISKDREGILMKTRFGLHTFFIRNPLDIIILDKNNKVKIIKEGLKPRKFFFWNPKFDTVLELPEGTIGKLEIKINDIIKVIL